jgi:tetratricopeptide (TPR) repeat protein
MRVLIGHFAADAIMMTDRPLSAKKQLPAHTLNLCFTAYSYSMRRRGLPTMPNPSPHAKDAHTLPTEEKGDVLVDMPSDFADVVYRLRELACWTQEELTERARLSVTTVSELERRVHPTCQKNTAQLLADAFELSGRCRDLFVAVARGRAPASALAADGLWDMLCGQATHPGLPGLAASPGEPWSAASQMRYSLPPDAAGFTGRDAELDQVSAAMAGIAGGVPVICTIDGMPGVGKSALAVRAAHLAADLFPDRRLFIDLHGHTPGQDQMTAADALAGLLNAVGIDARHLPTDAGTRAALWRDRTAGQRMLLLLDNAVGSAQVTPLLPGNGECLVLVTSRRHLGDLPGAVTRVTLDVLPRDQGTEMFLRLAPRARGSGAGAVSELTRLAGFLPLAISLLARLYARHPTWTLDDLAVQTRTSMLTLAAEDASVAAAFEVSYQHLSQDQQHLLRCLALHPGATIEAYAAAALAGTCIAEAARWLDGLHREGLLTEVSCHRYGMHDLIRSYARERAVADAEADRARAAARLLDFYTWTAAMAESRLGLNPRAFPALAEPSLETPTLADRAGALAWARSERANLLACLDNVTESGQHSRVVALTANMSALLLEDGPWTDAISRHKTAAHSARCCGDRLAQAHALANLGVVQERAGDYLEAAQAHKEALILYRELGDRLGEGRAVRERGIICSMTGNYTAAVRDLREALAISRELGDRLGEADSWYELGTIRWLTGDTVPAVQAAEEALAIYRDLGDRRGEANALMLCGSVRQVTGEFLTAARAQQEALGIFRDLGLRQGAAGCLAGLGEVWTLTGEYPTAIQALQEALGIYRELGSRLGEANVLLGLADIWLPTGRCDAAADAAQEAMSIYRDLGGRAGEADAYGALGVARQMTGDYAAAGCDLEQALALYRDVGERGGEVSVLNKMGALHRAQGDLNRARDCHRQALDLARGIGSRWEEAQSLAGQGRCDLAGGHTAAAVKLLRNALMIFQNIGAAESIGVAAELKACIEVTAR